VLVVEVLVEHWAAPTQYGAFGVSGSALPEHIFKRFPFKRLGGDADSFASGNRSMACLG
jgi:hypothetical protein